MPLIDLRKLTPISFPTAEDDGFEFKSSLTPADDLAKKLNKSASGFANAGGGCFIWGVDDETGDPDGGVLNVVGRQRVEDWIDKILHNVSPPPKYDLHVYTDNEGRGRLDDEKVIVAVSIHPSAAGPHMAQDNKYYIRGGRHTLPANHAIVEALWARRQVVSPKLASMLTSTAFGSGHKIALTVVNLTNAPALDISLDINPKMNRIAQHEKHFPIRVPLINQQNPFSMFLAFSHHLKDVLNDEIVVQLTYKDMAGNSYTDQNEESLLSGLPPELR